MRIKRSPRNRLINFRVLGARDLFPGGPCFSAYFGTCHEHGEEDGDAIGLGGGGEWEGEGAYLERVSSYLRSYSWLARLICIVFVKSHARTVKSNLNEVFHQSVILLSKSFICSMAV